MTKLTTDALVKLLTTKTFSLVLASMQPDKRLLVHRVDGVEVEISSYHEWIARDPDSDAARLQQISIEFNQCLRSLETTTLADPVGEWFKVIFGSEHKPGGVIGLLRPLRSAYRGGATTASMAKADNAIKGFCQRYDPQGKLNIFFAQYAEGLASIASGFIDYVDAEIISAGPWPETQTQLANSQGRLSVLPPAVIAERICIYLLIILRNVQHVDLYNFDFGPLTEFGNPYERPPIFFRVDNTELANPKLLIELGTDPTGRGRLAIRAIAKYIASRINKVDYVAGDCRPKIVEKSDGLGLTLTEMDDGLRQAIKEEYVLALQAMREIATGQSQYDPSRTSDTEQVTQEITTSDSQQAVPATVNPLHQLEVAFNESQSYNSSQDRQLSELDANESEIAAIQFIKAVPLDVNISVGTHWAGLYGDEVTATAEDERASKRRCIEADSQHKHYPS